MKIRIKNILKSLINIFHYLGNYHVRVFQDDNSIKVDFLIGPFFSKYLALKFAEKYLEKYIEVPLNCIILDKKNICKYNLLPKFKRDRIDTINFNQELLNLHKKNFLLGKVLKYIHNDSIVVDIGANKGLYSAAFAEKAKFVYAFEVSDPVLVQLMETASKFKNIRIIKKAANDRNINLPFFIDEHRFSNSGLVKQVKGPLKKVECIKIDEYFLEKNIKVDFVKIDTEGTELNVLKGMTGLIEKFRPYIMVECWSKQSTYNHEEIHSFFSKRNYYFYTNIKACGMVNFKYKETFIKISESSILEKITDCDFFFSPEPLW